MQVILGAGGVIGRELSANLPQFTDKVRLVGRNPVARAPHEESFPCDLLDRERVAEAVRGADVAYLVAGLRYHAATWAREWPVVMDNTIAACARHQVKLVFFDNVYMYGKVAGPMTEATPVNPCSKKGEVRAAIAARLLAADKAGDVRALIARSADFYGPGATLTFVHGMVFGKVREGMTAAWLVNDGVRHSFTFTPDAGRATALLGNTADAYGRVWHLPTHRDALTGRQFIAAAGTACGKPARHRVLGAGMMRFAGLFNPLARESVEMLYQYADEYLFDSSAFEARFFAPTGYADGIARCVAG